MIITLNDYTQASIQQREDMFYSYLPQTSKRYAKNLTKTKSVDFFRNAVLAVAKTDEIYKIVDHQVAEDIRDYILNNYSVQNKNANYEYSAAVGAYGDFLSALNNGGINLPNSSGSGQQISSGSANGQLTTGIAIKNAYDKNNFLSEVYMDEGDYDQLVSLLLRKKNLILQGAPGVGKTFAAKRLAYAIMGERDDDGVLMVQFHQNYSYEDFVMGYKPNSSGGFDLCEGIFYRFCRKAAADKDRKYFFIIDEINRGNLSKIFGELLMLIEKDYRDTPLQMSNLGNFTVPSNLYIIGMMNTADRSLAMIDYALRRRFSFYEMKPAFESHGFKDYAKKLHDLQLNNLVSAIVALNDVIAKDDSLGTGFCIGHSYLCGLDGDYDLKSIVEYDIIPMLREYWFDNDERFNAEAKKLRDAVR